MGQKLQDHINAWKKKLLDLGRRNKLISYKDSKTATVRVVAPSIGELYDLITDGKELSFPCVINKPKILDIFALQEGKSDEDSDTIVKGDLSTDKETKDLQRVLKRIREKSKESIEERGINALYIAFGLLKWTENDNSSQEIMSPIILVPVKLTIASLTSPYVLSAHEDEIVLNPTLAYKMQNDFGIELPEFDATKDSPIEGFLQSVREMVNVKGWIVEDCACLGLFSFQKVNMYKDLDMNEELLKANPIVSALAGEENMPAIPEEFNNYDHDTRVKPIDTFQVVDADSSQQDAILLSKSNVSFVLQGPPGTGKSQTITNIISEALADGKKVLFVSEKMAALQVVYNRLADVGLSDYCLALHNPKANKKEMLNELSNSLSINRTRVREEAISQLTFLERKRQQLNNYHKELHTPCSELKITIFYANGELSKLEDTQDVIFEIADIEKIDKSELDDRLFLLSELSKTIGKKTEEYVNNVWRGSCVETVTNSLRQDIDFNVSKLLPLLKDSQSIIEYCGRTLFCTTSANLQGLSVLAQYLEIAGRSPIIPKEWVLSTDLQNLETDISTFKMLVTSYNEQFLNVAHLYIDSVWSDNIDSLVTSLSDNSDNLLQQINCDDSNSLTEKANDLTTKLSDYEKSISSSQIAANSLTCHLQLRPANKVGNVHQVIEYVKAFRACRSIRPSRKWFDSNKLSHIKESIAIAQTAHKECIALKQDILNEFDKDVFSMDFYPMLQRFRTQYNSFFRFLKGGYRREIKEIRQYSLGGKSVNYNDALNLLERIKKYDDYCNEIRAKGNTYKEDYGIYYKEFATNWDELTKKLKEFEDIKPSFGNIFPNQVSVIVDDKAPFEEIHNLYEKLEKENFSNVLNELNALLREQITDSTSIDSVLAILKQLQEDLKMFIGNVNSAKSYRKSETTFVTMLSELKDIVELKRSKEYLDAKEQYCKQQFKQLYNGLETDWEKITDALCYAKDLKDYIANNYLTEQCVVKICTDDEYISQCKSKSKQLNKILLDIDEPLKWFISLFEDSSKFNNYTISQLEEKLRLCCERKYLLEEWVDFQSIRKKCESNSLAEYVSVVETENISADSIVDVYMKRFYYLWLDAILPNFPSVNSFRSNTFEQTIQEFRCLDKGQFEIARARIREKINDRMPNFNGFTQTNDEVGILKRELNKQRKIMPIRKLFSEIPNLLTTMRPCFMMSPLSVSVFLKADCYNFDMVIFDEASQVHTEDAIGAIMRGKQVIIVGDTKQLPPTNFFSTSVNNDDFDNDDENWDVDSFESILDEAITALPERTLQWHYRSKHEHLITFSNIKIYNGRLITFPSSADDVKDNGVEYVYVENGVYDRSGKRCNIVEATRVADLVFEHFNTHPNRSLGIVSFSEAQQSAIDAEIRHRRLQNPSYEKFFSEESEEPFFIKNLENVQGDERDTIIFSIGYAKDAHGVMYMNFGPLSRDGGERRLNVAITRAKYNVKLVGSIIPTDIDLSKTSQKGVKMLRSYIEFAQRGFSAIEGEIKLHDSLQFDSPFEESVYDFLTAKGYDVVTQVGCSGYRIDMAVKHPLKPGHFSIGIECDGATYHNSRTARERDRLRQSVLESMGWNIYRIWSTDWIKSPKTEKEKLLRVIETSFLSNYQKEKNIESKVIEPLVTIEEEIIEDDEDVDESNPFDFELFTPVDEMYIFRKPDEAINLIINAEQPILYDELCRKMAPVLNRQAATSYVKKEVDKILKRIKDIDIDSNKFIRRKNFILDNARYTNEPEIRPIKNICTEELKLAMVTVIKKSVGITPENLLFATSKALGYKQRGKNITEALNEVYLQLWCDNVIEEIGGKATITMSR